MDIKLMNLHLFDNTNVTTQTGANQDLSAEMKEFYSMYLIKNAEPVLVHDQFGQKHPIPKNGGKQIEFRKYSPFPKALTPLTEGVTPSGRKLNVSVITATVAQYGDYVEISDVLQLTAIDDNILQATKLCASQAGETLDTVTREVLNAGTNVHYCNGKLSRATLAGTDVLTVDEVKKVVRTLKYNKAKKIDGSYVAIIHTDVAYDIMTDSKWVDASLYAGSTQIFNGEIGKIAGVRFVETTEAKIFAAAGASSADVYSTLFIGQDAYGVTEIEGGGLEHIVKQLGSGGTTDPLNQRATVGWKAMKTAEILVDPYMVRCESGGALSRAAN